MSDIDLTGGLDPAFEWFRADRPEDPGIRDSATLWILDQSGDFAFPRVTFDGIGETWETPWVQLNFAHADGRVMRVWSQQEGAIEHNADGLPAIRHAGGLRIQCLQPFQRWAMDFDGPARQSDTASEIAGESKTTPAHIAFHVEATMAAPPWLMGGMTADATRQMAQGEAGALMGGVRYEQLCRLTGWIEIDGERRPIDGTGMRVRRQGVRNMGAALGHCQHSALWPSGRAFGAIIMAPGPEGPIVFNEAFVITPDGRKLAASVFEAPWMHQLVEDDDASLVLATSEGEVRIAGRTLLSMFDHHNFEMADTSVLHQGTARYTWDGEETIGLIERCTQREKLS